MVTNTRERIISYIKYNKQARVHDLVKALGITNAAIHRQIKALLSDGVLRKVGRPPLVFYVLDEQKQNVSVQIPVKILKVIDSNYLYITSSGELKYGFEGFTTWAKATGQEKRVLSLALEYVKTLEEAKKQTTKDGLIDATYKIRSTFKNEAYLDKLLYGDFYSLPKFGKTKLGQMVLYSKQSQKRELMDEVGKIVKPTVEKIIRNFKVDAVAFIPPTVPRKLQFMNEIRSILGLPLPVIELVKVSGEVSIPQKTLSSLKERIENARETIYMKHIAENSYPNVLIIDDAAGSGSTLNETAHKLKSVNIGSEKIIGFVVVGSMKGFEVIREV